ncbi:hypothetical protein TWF694_010183 [Orbilia ellipsospora]|uniref:DUF221-domain-containing protein n=1 Tax=Orbilia ellipsospora TaxID=2528407 RepID=A0AAV9XAA4_9PEZI
MEPSCPWSSSASLLKRQNVDHAALLRDFLHDQFQNQFNKAAFSFNIGTSFLVSFVLFALFCWIRPLHTSVYAPRLQNSNAKNAPPEIEKGYFSWLIPVFKIEEHVLIDNIGLDAIVFLRFVRMLRNMFAVLSIGALIMLAVNAGCTARNTELFDQAGGSVDPLIYTSPQYVTGTCLYAHVLESWIFNIVICYFIWSSYRKIVQLKVKHFQSEEYRSALYAKTLMVTDVPGQFQSNDGLADIVGRTKVDDSIKQDMKARIARDTRELPKLVKKHEKAVRKLEGVLAKYLSNPDWLPPNRPTMKPFKEDRRAKGSGKIDAIEYLDQRIRKLETRIKEIRNNIDLKNPLPYGFVSFSTVENAHTVAYSVHKKKKIEGTKIKLAPKPMDLLWENLAKTKRQRRWNRTWGWALYVFLTVVWTVPNAFIATFLANFNRIGALWPEFATLAKRHPNFWALMQGVLAPLVTAGVFLLLPTIMRRISARQGDITKTARERHALAKLFSFFIFNNLFIFTILGTIWNFVAQVVAETGGVSRKTAIAAILDFKLATQSITAVFGVSRFWIMYLLMRNMGALLDMVQLYTLFVRWYARKFLSPTPRELIEWSAPQPMDYAAYYNYFLFYATIAFMFVPVQPLVIVVACFYFFIESFFRKYQMMYMFVTKTESGGAFWRVLVNRTLVAASFGNIVTGGIVWVNFNGKAAIAALVPVLGLIAFKVYCVRAFDDKMAFYTQPSPSENLEGGQAGSVAGRVSEAQMKSHREDRLSDRYGHPALTRKLLVPLVHEKVKHLLERVYTLRLEDGDTYPPAALSQQEAGVGVDRMRSEKVGVAERQGAGLEQFGFLKEHQLDFNSLTKSQKQEFASFGYVFEMPGSRPGTPGRPLSWAGLAEASRPGTPGGGGGGYYTQQTVTRYTTTEGGTSSSSSTQSQAMLATAQRVMTPSPLAAGMMPGVEAAGASGYFPHIAEMGAGDSDTDLTGLLGRGQGMGRSLTPGVEGYDSRPTSSHSFQPPNAPFQQRSRPQTPQGASHPRNQPSQQQQQQQQGPTNYEAFRKG